MPQMGDILLIGSNHQMKFDDVILNQKIQTSTIRKNLELIKIENVAMIIGTFLLDDQRVRKLAYGGQLNTDDQPFIEFNAPKYLHSETQFSNLKFLFFNQNSHRNLIRVSNMVVKEEDAWFIRSAGTRILRDNRPSSPLTAQWFTAYTLADDTQKLTLKSSVSVDWSDSTSQFNLVSGIQSNSKNGIETNTILAAYLPYGVTKSGTTNLHDKTPAFWALGLTDQPNQSMLGIAWECSWPNNPGFQIIARRLFTESNLDSKNLDPERLAQKFRCADPLSAQ
jgi:hypothetical protein